MNKKIDIPWTADQIAQAYALRKQGFTLSYIGKDLGRTKSAVAGMFRREDARLRALAILKNDARRCV